VTLPNGHYRTEAGSTVEVYGKHSGSVRVSFDWLEERGACCDCQVDPYPEHWGGGEYRLMWHCEDCDGGSAVLEPDPEAEEAG
jgi:hypothetical protein